MHRGYIKVYRKLTDSWLFENEKYFKSWITILFEVNHKDRKVLINNSLLECNRGQSLNSINSWSLLFGNGWTPQKVRTYFKLLEDDGKINTQGMSKTTRLTVLNYDTYQSEQQTDNKQSNKQITNRKQTDNEQITTNNNVNTLKDINKELKKETISLIPETISEVDNTKLILNELFNRRENTEWSDKEKSKLKEIKKRSDFENELIEINDFYKTDYEFKRQNIITLLNNWSGELDKSRAKNKTKQYSKDDCFDPKSGQVPL